MGYPGPSYHSEEKLRFNIAKPHNCNLGDQELLNLNASTLGRGLSLFGIGTELYYLWIFIEIPWKRIWIN